jgi:hypothetical protein
VIRDVVEDVDSRLLGIAVLLVGVEADELPDVLDLRFLVGCLLDRLRGFGAERALKGPPCALLRIL